MKKELSNFFDAFQRDRAVFEAMQEGYSKSEIANYLGISPATVAKIYRNYLRKRELFGKLKKDGIFWSYSKDLRFEDSSEAIVIENTLKYGDFDDISSLIKLYGKRKVKKVWEKSMRYEPRFKKVNYLIGRVFLGLDIEIKDLQKSQNARFEKLSLEEIREYFENELKTPITITDEEYERIEKKSQPTEALQRLLNED